LNGNHSDKFTFFLYTSAMTNHFIILHPSRAVARAAVCPFRTVPNSDKKHRNTKIGWSSNTTNYIK